MKISRRKRIVRLEKRNFLYSLFLKNENKIMFIPKQKKKRELRAI